MAIIDPTTGLFKIVEIPTYELDEVTGSNDDYIYKPSFRVSQLFNSTWLSRYQSPRKVVYDNISDFK